ncbi:MAG: GumC family protein [Methylobacterium sp.]
MYHARDNSERDRRSRSDVPGNDGGLPAQPAWLGDRGRDEPWVSPRVAGITRPPAAPTPNEIARWLLRGRFFILLAVVLGAAAATGFVVLSKPRYTSYTDLLILPANLNLTPNDLYTPNLQSDSQILEVESKMRMMTSGNVLRRLVASLDLKDVPEFVDDRPVIDLPQLLGFPSRKADPVATAMAALSERIKVARQERSYMITAAVWCRTAEQSARVANGLADAFKEELAQTEADGAGRVARDLSNRLTALREAVSEADTQVETFRRRHGLQLAASGQLVNAQSMERMNSRSVDARSRLAEATSRYNELLRASGDRGGGTAALQSPTLTTLRNEAVTARKQVDALSLTYGEGHPVLATARSELRSLTAAIAGEIDRLRRSAKIDVDEARATLAALATETLSLRGSVSGDDDAQIKLRELERNAKAKATLYQAYLTRAGETAERQRIDATDVRVISQAVPPPRRGWPPRLEIAVPIGAIAGGVLGAILAAAWGFLATRRHLWKVA